MRSPLFRDLSLGYLPYENDTLASSCHDCVMRAFERQWLASARLTWDEDGFVASLRSSSCGPSHDGTLLFMIKGVQR